jgi:hypothetical protein
MVWGQHRLRLDRQLKWGLNLWVSRSGCGGIGCLVIMLCSIPLFLGISYFNMSEFPKVGFTLGIIRYLLYKVLLLLKGLMSIFIGAQAFICYA